MEIPKKVQKLLDKRVKLAMELIATEDELDKWLIDNGADMTDCSLADSILSGCMMYCEPASAKINVEDYIRNKMRKGRKLYGK